MRIDLHNHTVYSKHWFWGIDALNTPEEMIKAAIKRGLDGIAITDHNYVKSSLKAKQQARRIDKDFLVVTGTEIRSEAGDVLALGVKEDVEPGLSVEETVEKIRDIGGLAVAPHPFSRFILRECIGEEASKADAVEIFNASSNLSFHNTKAKAFAIRHNMPVSAGSDSHCIRTVGNAGIIYSGDPIEDIRKRKVKVFGRRTRKSDMLFLIAKKYGRAIKWRILNNQPEYR